MKEGKRMGKRMVRILAQALALALVGSALGALFNLVRPDGLEWVASKPFEIYKPCPLLAAEAAPIELADLPADLGALVILDARSLTEFEQNKMPGSRSLPYHPLNAPDPAVVAELKALGPSRILVVGDVQIDSGRLLAGDLAEAGCLGVRYLKGGFDAWAATQAGAEAP
jgi:rhodanese-related sulfurtransferase